MCVVLIIRVLYVAAVVGVVNLWLLLSLWCALLSYVMVVTLLLMLLVVLMFEKLVPLLMLCLLSLLLLVSHAAVVTLAALVSHTPKQTYRIIADNMLCSGLHEQCLSSLHLATGSLYDRPWSLSSSLLLL